MIMAIAYLVSTVNLSTVPVVPSHNLIPDQVITVEEIKFSPKKKAKKKCKKN
jgi:hypothetical protein